MSVSTFGIVNVARLVREWEAGSRVWVADQLVRANLDVVLRFMIIGGVEPAVLRQAIREWSESSGVSPCVEFK